MKRLDLAGAWRMRTAPAGLGVQQAWFATPFPDDEVSLPGTMDDHPGPVDEGGNGLKGFSVRRPFRGAVWYQREIAVPEAWRGRQVELYLERCQWESSLWVDGVAQGTQNSLVAPHLHRLAGPLSPGSHLLTVLVDNANRKHGMRPAVDPAVLHVDLTTEVRQEAKLNCGGHHQSSHNWNGILGRLELRALAPVHLLGVDVYPRLGDGTVGLRLKLGNPARVVGEAELRAVCAQPEAPAAEAGWTLRLDGSPEQVVEQRLAVAGAVRTWDEFSPALYQVSVRLTAAGGSDERTVSFGMREVARQGIRLVLNGRPLFLRGTLEDFIFPITGHPPMEVPAWRKILATAKSYGLNHLRFHTCCPPEAAFAAADALGLYLQVEVPGTSCPQRDEGPEVEAFLGAELARLLAEYGNHPSMLLVSMGNEQLIADAPDFTARHQEVLARKVRAGQAQDPRHLYTSTTHPWTPGRCDDFFVSAWPVLPAPRLIALCRAHHQGVLPAEPPLCGIQWSGFRVIDSSRFNTSAPETGSDYAACLSGLDRPLLSHEVGQWAVYPDLREISRYHGAQAASNFALIREDLRRKGLLEWAADFTRASGMLALALYKEEIESALRTRELSGFQLLDLHDYPGQGTSTVGILNALWESKGLTTPAEFRAFCAPVVALARLPRRVWTADETLTAEVEIANHSAVALPGGDLVWRLRGADGRSVAQGAWPGPAVPAGGLTRVGGIAASLSGVAAAEKLVLQVSGPGLAANSWDVWVYPQSPPAAVPSGVTVATCWDAAVRAELHRGGCVLLLPGAGELVDPVPGTFTPVFWNGQMKAAQPAKTMGLLIDPAQPALAGFPTEYHSNWQWWDLVMRSSALRLDGLPPALRPAVMVIDGFTGNRRLAMLVEARVGAGRLLVCSADLRADLGSRPVARQLWRSLLAYLAGPLFLPDVPVSEEELASMLVRR